METHLTIKHLAPYLPYGLKVKWKHCEDDSPVFEFKIRHLEDVGKSDRYQIKPILRPLSDLTNTQGNHFVVDHISSSREMTDKLIHVIETNKFRYTQLKCWQFEKLVENHFDVFGLIEKGLAIDINTLKETA